MKERVSIIYKDNDIFFYAKDEEEFNKLLSELDRGTCNPYGDYYFKLSGWYRMYLITCNKCRHPAEYIYYVGENINGKL